MRQSVQSFFRIIEEHWQTIIQRGIPAGALRDQVNPSAIPPASGSARGGVLLSDSNPVANGTAAPGTGSAASRGDHVHPAASAAYLDLINASAPATPASGITRVYAKTDKLTYQKNDAGTETGLAGGGGSTISTGAAGSEPGSPSAGDLYLPNNGFVQERYSGSVWAPWGPIFPMTAPPTAGWSWVNQGGASISGFTITDPANNAISYRIRTRAQPTPPYTITAALLAPHLISDFINYGIGWRQSSDGKLVLLRAISLSGIWNLNPLKATDATTDSASYTAIPFVPRDLLWVQISDNSTNRICRYSADGQHWIDLHTVGNTDFLTADEVCFYVNSRNATYSMSASLISWAVT